VYKVTIQNINQIYFSLQDHKGKRISLTQYEMLVFNGLSQSEANSYKKYIPLGLSVIIQEDNSFICTDYKVVETVEVKPEIVEVNKSFNYSIEDLKLFKREDLRALCLDVNIDIKRKTKAELIEELVNFYGL